MPFHGNHGDPDLLRRIRGLLARYTPDWRTKQRRLEGPELLAQRDVTRVATKPPPPAAYYEQLGALAMQTGLTPPTLPRLDLPQKVTPAQEATLGPGPIQADATRVAAQPQPDVVMGQERPEHVIGAGHTPEFRPIPGRAGSRGRAADLATTALGRAYELAGSATAGAHRVVLPSIRGAAAVFPGGMTPSEGWTAGKEQADRITQRARDLAGLSEYKRSGISTVNVPAVEGAVDLAAFMVPFEGAAMATSALAGKAIPWITRRAVQQMAAAPRGLREYNLGRGISVPGAPTANRQVLEQAFQGISKPTMVAGRALEAVASPVMRSPGVRRSVPGQVGGFAGRYAPGDVALSLEQDFPGLHHLGTAMRQEEIAAGGFDPGEHFLSRLGLNVAGTAVTSALIGAVGRQGSPPQVGEVGTRPRPAQPRRLAAPQVEVGLRPGPRAVDTPRLRAVEDVPRLQGPAPPEVPLGARSVEQPDFPELRLERLRGPAGIGPEVRLDELGQPAPVDPDQRGLRFPERLPGEVDTGMEGRWYSRLQAAIEEAPTPLPGGKATGQEWNRFLDPAKRGFGEMETEWTGLRGYLADNADEVLTKDEVLGFARENEIKLKETIKSDARVDVARGQLQDAGAPGDLVDYLPGDVGPRPRFADQTQGQFGLDPKSNYEEILVRLDRPEGAGRPFTGGHWKEPDVLGHIRKTDREVTAVEGRAAKGKSFHVEEFQSDPLQEAREVGFESDRVALEAEADALDNKRIAELQEGLQANTIAMRLDPEVPEMERLLSRREEIIRSGKLRGEAVPDMPYKNTSEWAALLARRALQRAVKGGHDRISWATGKQAAEQAAQLKRVSRIEYDQGTGTLEAWDLDGERVIKRSGITPEKLHKQIGKGSAARLMEPVGAPEEKLAAARALQGEELAAARALQRDAAEKYATEIERSIREGTPGPHGLFSEEFRSSADAARGDPDAVVGSLERYGYGHEQMDELGRLEKRGSSPVRNLRVEEVQATRDDLIRTNVDVREHVGTEVGDRIFRVVDENTGDVLTSRRAREAAEEVVERMERVRSIGALPGEDLTIGGQGMIEFYDRIVPNAFMKELKKYGAVLEGVDVIPPNPRKTYVQEGVDVEPPDVRQQGGWNGAWFRYEGGQRIDFPYDTEQAALADAIPSARERNLSIKITPQIRDAIEGGTRLAMPPHLLVGAAVGGLGGAAAPAESEEERWNNILKGAIGGGVAGATVAGASSRLTGPAGARFRMGARDVLSRRLAGRPLGEGAVVPQEAVSGGRHGFAPSEFWDRLNQAGGTMNFTKDIRVAQMEGEGWLSRGTDVTLPIVEALVPGTGKMKVAVLFGHGFYEGGYNPNEIVTLDVELGGPDIAESAINAYRAVNGVLRGQDAQSGFGLNPVGSSDPKATGGWVIGRYVNGKVGALKPAELERVAKDLAKAGYDSTVLDSNGRVVVIDYDGAGAALDQAVLGLPGEGIAAEPRDFTTLWTEGTHAYLEAFQGNGRAVEGVASHLSDRVLPVYERWATELGLGPDSYAGLTARIEELEAHAQQLERPLSTPESARSGLEVADAAKVAARQFRRLTATSESSIARTLGSRMKTVIDEFIEGADLDPALVSDWFKGGTRKARLIAQNSIPELRNDADFTVFTTISSLLSNGQTVASEAAAGLGVMEQYYRTGKFSVMDPGLPGSAQRAAWERSHYTFGVESAAGGLRGQKAMRGPQGWSFPTLAGDAELVGGAHHALTHEDGLMALNDMVDDLGLEGAAAYLQTTVNVLRDGVRTDVLVMEDVFGEKVGRYSGDKLGLPDLGRGTVDAWGARGYHILMGSADNISAAGKIDDAVPDTMRDRLNVAFGKLAKARGSDIKTVQALFWYGVKWAYLRAGGAEKQGAYDTLQSAAARALAVPGPLNVPTPATTEIPIDLMPEVSMGIPDHLVPRVTVDEGWNPTSSWAVHKRRPEYLSALAAAGRTSATTRPGAPALVAEQARRKALRGPAGR